MTALRIYIDSYSNAMQNGSGGISMRIRKLYNEFTAFPEIKVHLFNKWTDKLSDCDILHVFKITLDSYAQICFAKKIGKKVVVSSVVAQEGYSKIRMSLLLNKIFPVHNTHSILRECLRQADAIIAQTEQEKRFIITIYNISKEKILVIPNGVEEKIKDCYNPEIKKDLILNVGRFDSNKNQLTLIKALKNTQIPCYFIGGEAIEESEYYNQCKKIAERCKNLFFCGWLPNTSKECLDLYARAKVVVLISRKEIFGNSLIEGAACGANLVVTSALPTEEWGFNENCIKVKNVRNIKEVRDAVMKAFEMPISEELRDIASLIFSWRDVAKRYVTLYKKLR